MRGSRAIALQLALDLYDLDEALRVADRCAEHVDHLEVGTPLIWRNGVKAIETVRREFPDATIVADAKIMDRGAEIAREALEVGANGVIVQAAAARETVEAVCVEVAASGGMVMVDGLGVGNLSALHRATATPGATHVIAHLGKDEQAAGISFEIGRALDEAHGRRRPILGIAGGLAPADVVPLLSTQAVGLLVVGEAICSAGDPSAVAAALRALCTSTEGARQ